MRLWKFPDFLPKHIVAIAGHVIIYSTSVNDNVSPAEKRFQNHQ